MLLVLYLLFVERGVGAGRDGVGSGGGEWGRGVGDGGVETCRKMCQKY